MMADDCALWGSYGAMPCKEPVGWTGGLDLDDLLREMMPGPDPSLLQRDPWERPRALPETLPQCFRTRGELRRHERTPSPRRDNRGPVEDSYEVSAAIADFAQRRAGDRSRHHHEDLERSVRQLSLQAQRLQGLCANSALEERVRSHYARVHEELLAEAQKLAFELLADPVAAGRPVAAGHSSAPPEAE
mmetsp:Transcript_80368/g.260379  ORF Transcript_80368/g.260379 Transcript_80368/m.260379 type:complete len:189 (+) Transcript_80368:108-674(+)